MERMMRLQAYDSRMIGPGPNYGRRPRRKTPAERIDRAHQVARIYPSPRSYADAVRLARKLGDAEAAERINAERSRQFPDAPAVES